MLLTRSMENTEKEMGGGESCLVSQLLLKLIVILSSFFYSYNSYFCDRELNVKNRMLLSLSIVKQAFSLFCLTCYNIVIIYKLIKYKLL